MRPQNPPINSTDVSRTNTGFRLYGQYSVLETTDVFLSLGYGTRRDDTAFSRSTQIAIGKDKTYDATLGVTWRFLPLWSVRAQYLHMYNRSNIDLFSFKRDEYLMLLRREIR